MDLSVTELKAVQNSESIENVQRWITACITSRYRFIGTSLICPELHAVACSSCLISVAHAACRQRTKHSSWKIANLSVHECTVCRIHQANAKAFQCCKLCFQIFNMFGWVLFQILYPTIESDDITTNTFHHYLDSNAC